MRQALSRRLMDEGIVASQKEAAALVMSGRVYVNGQRARAGQQLKSSDRLQVRGLQEKYLAKGGLKLEGAISAFGIQVAGRVCIDAGASTGGFTDCLLKHGAQLVYAVDVGYGQLMGSLRQDARVVNMERCNLADPALTQLSPVPDLGSCDLSYLSLRLAVPLFKQAMQSQGDLMCLVKPLFETEDMEARRSGVLAHQAYGPLLCQLMQDLALQPDTQVLQLCHSPITGNTGTREFFLHVRFGSPGDSPAIPRSQVEACVAQALALQPYARPGLVMAEEVE